MTGQASRGSGVDSSAGTGRDAFTPLIVTFTCNWCSYAGADFAGISRRQYPATIRNIRLMCSGRVHPAFILSALEMGADGVLVTGCHPGDCHYSFGNASAEHQVRSAQELAEMAGLHGDRIRLQWVSASEGALFSRTVEEFTDHIIERGPNPLRRVPPEPSVVDMACTPPVDMTKPSGPSMAHATTPEGFQALQDAFDSTHAYRCIECGKCTGICPVTARFPAFHPRHLVVRGLYGLDGELAYDHTIWACLECGLCREACRVDVDLPEFVRRLRSLARSEGQCEVGTHGGLVHTFDRLCSHDFLQPDLTTWSKEGRLRFSRKSEMVFVSGYGGALEQIVPDVEFDAGATPRDTVRILNSLGIRPQLFEAERPSGHDLYYTGDNEAFGRLAMMNSTALRETGAQRAVFTCPETMHTYQDLYPAVTGDPLGLECVHFTELVAEALGEERVALRMLPGDSGRGAIAYHDSCRMGRMLGLYVEPRITIEETGDRLVELEHNRGLADCCGVGAWQRCDPTSRELRLARLQEALDAGADRLVTPCSRCTIHFACQQCHDGVDGKQATNDVEIIDLATYVANRLVKL
jgi:Fe-S oxidoreductase/coenzyme F420-reducing hydrogenase delta subunit